MCLVISCSWYPGLLAGLGILYHMDECVLVWTFKNSVMFCLNERIIIWDMQRYIPYILSEFFFLSVHFLQLQLSWCCVSFPVLKCLCVCVFHLFVFLRIIELEFLSSYKVLIFKLQKLVWSLQGIRLISPWSHSWHHLGTEGFLLFLGRLLTSYC